jgi:TolB-like protein
MLFVFGDCTLDPNRRELRRRTSLVAVEPQVFDLLEYLIRNRERVVSREDLNSSIWGGRVVSESALSARINAARSAIGDSGAKQRWIKTLSRKGFRFVGSVRQENAVATSSGQYDVFTPAVGLPDRPSIAVLPFANMGGDPEQDYFCDGVVEDIITGLSRIKWLFVIARNSSLIYKGRATDVKQVGSELGVRYVLEGSVRKAGKRVRVTCQLIEAHSNAHLWAEHYDRPLNDIFALQDEVTLAVIGTIEPRLRSAEIDRVKRKRPESLDAYDLLLRAISTDMAMPEGVAKAKPFLERALALEPDYARAHGHLALCHHTLYLRGGLREENRRSAIRHAHAAIANGQDDSTALSLAGFVIGMDGRDRAGAYQAFEAALALSPSSAFTYLMGSPVLGWGGQAERAVEWAERALRLSPFDPWNWFPCHGLALGHFSLGHHGDAAAAARLAIQCNPRFSVSYMLLAASLVEFGRLEEAKSAATHVLALQPSYRFGKHFAGVDCAPALAASLSEALTAVGLPE